MLAPPSDEQAGSLRRASCAACLRPQRACICHWIAPVANDVEVLVLQHPGEVHHAKGSARLLHLSLARCSLVVGETFDEQALRTLVHGPLERHGEGTVIPRAVLLYPCSAQPHPALKPAPAIDCAWLERPARLRLIVLDATWRKSLKMLCCNPVLQGLPRLALRDVPPSAYLVRKAPRPHQLSTLEAVCRALMRLEQAESRYGSLLAAFTGFVGQQLAYRNVGAESPGAA